MSGETTKYDSALLISSMANWTRRRKLMITNSNRACFAKVSGCLVQEVTHAMELNSFPLSDGEA